MTSFDVSNHKILIILIHGHWLTAAALSGSLKSWMATLRMFFIIFFIWVGHLQYVTSCLNYMTVITHRSPWVLPCDHHHVHCLGSQAVLVAYEVERTCDSCDWHSAKRRCAEQSCCRSDGSTYFCYNNFMLCSYVAACIQFVNNCTQLSDITELLDTFHRSNSAQFQKEPWQAPCVVDQSDDSPHSAAGWHLEWDASVHCTWSIWISCRPGNLSSSCTWTLPPRTRLQPGSTTHTLHH